MTSRWKRLYPPEMLRVFLMNIEFAYGNREKALEMAKNLIDAGTPFPVPYLNYASHLASLGRPAEALALLTIALELGPKKTMRKNVLLTTATCLWLLGDPTAAAAALEDMRAEFGYMNPSALTTLGYMYFLTGDYDKAEAVTNEALAESPEFAAAWDNLGQISYARRDLERARERFAKALECNPSLADSNYLMGMIEEERGDAEQAARFFARAAECPVTALNTVKAEEIANKCNYHK